MEFRENTPNGNRISFSIFLLKIDARYDTDHRDADKENDERQYIVEAYLAHS